MKRIVICCDGTWNTAEQVNQTNVAKTREAVAATADGVRQLVYYHDGVGTRSLVDRLPGGIFGAGLWKNVQLAYAYLVENYEVGDELFFFGFSRGAFTVRSLAGMVRKCGILRLDEAGRIAEAYDFYRNRKVAPTDTKAQAFRLKNSAFDPALPPERQSEPPPIRFVGVWDTVGALGIPLGMLGRIFNRKHRFHDVCLSRYVQYAYQALAIDEKRKPFRPTLWEQHPEAQAQTVEQRWFAGVHTNVGGGNTDSRQSDRALLWMLAKARACGLALDAGYVSANVEDDLGGELTSSLFQEITRRVPFNLLTYVRPIGAGVPVSEATYLGGLSREVVDPAVIDRNVAHASYMPPNLIAYFRDDSAAALQARQAKRDVWP